MDNKTKRKIVDLLSKSTKILVISGPTASGKTSLAVEFRDILSDSEILVFDSRQIYKEMNVATGKDLKDYGEKKPHLIDLILPNQNLTAPEFKTLAIEKIKLLQEKNKRIIITVGTGLYFRAIEENLVFAPSDENLRKELEAKNLDELKTELKKLDLKSFGRINIENKRRVVRAIETKILTGKNVYEIQAEEILEKHNFEFEKILLTPKREILHKKIDRRVESFFEDGIVEETKNLLQKYPPELNSMTGIGYKEAVDFLENKITIEQAKERMKARSRQYAKRQITWFKKYFLTKNKIEIDTIED